MPNVTDLMVTPFTRDGHGLVVPGEAKETPNGEAARRRAAAVAIAAGNVGAISFSRTGDPDNSACKLEQTTAFTLSRRYLSCQPM